jgi:subtilase family serine protease
MAWGKMSSSKIKVTLVAWVLLCLAGTAHAQSDFTYHANPPRIPLLRGEVIPQAIPFCSNGLVICYSPAFVRGAYNFPANLDGRGQTILIVDAYGSPTIRHDLAVFDKFFGIPEPPSFTILCPGGGCPKYNTKTPHDELGWAFETSLDVEYAHAMAPAANIVLVVGENGTGNAINLAEAKAIKLYPGSVMSQSFGTPEILNRGNKFQFLQAHKNYEAAAAAGITVLAAAGDTGATNGFATANANFPASDPLVLAVGGTEGNPYPGGLAGCGGGTCTGTYGGERVWNEPNYATGGAPSLIFAAPAYQKLMGFKMRTTPDVAYNSAIHGGVLVANSSLTGTDMFFLVGGTSAAAPQWAAIFALANQAAGHPLGFVNPAIYKLAESGAYSNDFHDITVGNNKAGGTPLGFNAAPGFDFATGWGTPNVANLIPDLIAAASD